MSKMLTIDALAKAIKERMELDDVDLEGVIGISLRYNGFSPSCGHPGSEFTSPAVAISFKKYNDRSYIIECKEFLGAFINVLVDIERDVYKENDDRLVIPCASPFEKAELLITNRKGYLRIR